MASDVAPRSPEPQTGGQRSPARSGGAHPVPNQPEVPARRSQEERSRATRQRLMEATLECLVEYGWSGTTTTVVAERAGVSRGAQLHHYPSRAELVVAAVEYVGEARFSQAREMARSLHDGHRSVENIVQLLGDFFDSPLFVAALELWVAARTDETLRATVVPLETRLGRETHRLTVELLGVDEGRPGVREAVQATLDLSRGLGLAALLTDDRARRKRLLEQYARMLEHALSDARHEGTAGTGGERTSRRRNDPAR